MSYLNDDLQRAFARIAVRPIPPAWADAQPVLTAHATPGDLVVTIRNERDVARSDEIVRALAALAPDHPDATVVLLEALARATFTRSRLGASAEFHTDLLVDLTCVILDGTDLANVDRLVDRLSRRAFSRTTRRTDANQRRAQVEIAMDAGLAMIEPVRSAEGEAITLVQMDHVCELLRGALASGELPDFVWQRFRDGRLAPLLGSERAPVDKRRVFESGVEVRQHLAHAS